MATMVSCQTDYKQVRAYYLERGISHCISGNCMQGNGKEDIGDGFVYEGHFENYVPDGDGSLYKEGQLVYAGKWDYGYPADRAVALDKKNAGTQGPIAGSFGPKMKNHGDAGSSKVLETIGRFAEQAEDRRSGRVPRRY